MDEKLAVASIVIELTTGLKDPPFRDVFDYVFGAGEYEKLASDIYDKVRGNVERIDERLLNSNPTDN